MSCLSVNVALASEPLRVKAKLASEPLRVNVTPIGNTLEVNISCLNWFVRVKDVSPKANVNVILLTKPLQVRVATICGFNLLRSCFSSGKWEGEKPWIGEEKWK